MMMLNWAHAICLLVWEGEQDKMPRVVGPFEDMDKAIEFKERTLTTCHRIEYAPMTNAEYAHNYIWGKR